jgi:serine phosphatase RsbU (regulator of sigma subunit)
VERAARLEQELRVARRIQRTLVLLTQPDIEGWQLASDYRPAREIGGDFFDVFPIAGSDGRRLGIVIADVSGKGISAAILMAFIRPVIRAAMDHTGDPVEALERTNRILVEERPTGLLVTALAGVLDLDSGELRFANAGHEPPLVARASTPGQVEELSAAGPLLGAFRSLGLPLAEARLGAGDALVLYTDGVTDAADPAGERFGPERFQRLVGEHGGVSAESVVQTVMAAVGAWEGDELADDLALLVIRRFPVAPELAPGHGSA